MKETPNYYAIIPANVRYDNDLADKAKLLYGEIIALSDKEGFCWATNNYFANLYGVSKMTISRLITQLAKKNYIEVQIKYKENTKEIEARYIKICIYPYIQKCIYPIYKNVKDNNINNNNTSNNNIYKQEFEELWKIYPNKKGKENAYKSFTKAVKAGTDIEIIKQGIEKYNEYIKNKKIEEQYIKHGSTWFNQKCWEDDYKINNNAPSWFNKEIKKEETEVKYTDEELSILREFEREAKEQRTI